MAACKRGQESVIAFTLANCKLTANDCCGLPEFRRVRISGLQGNGAGAAVSRNSRKRSGRSLPSCIFVWAQLSILSGIELRVALVVQA